MRILGDGFQQNILNASVVSAWSPLRLPNLKLWLDPSDLSTLFQDYLGTIPVTADGDPVGLILDKSGLGYHASQSISTRRPKYRTDGILHWLESDGVDDVLSTVQGSSVMDGGGMIAAAYMSNADERISGVVEEIESPVVDAGKRVALYADTRTSPMRSVVYSPDGDDELFDRDSKLVPSVSEVCVFNSDGVTGKSYIDNVEQLSTMATTFNFTGDTIINIGRQSVGGLYLNGRIYSVIMCDSGINSSQITSTSKYLAQKSGVTL